MSVRHPWRGVSLFTYTMVTMFHDLRRDSKIRGMRCYGKLCKMFWCFMECFGVAQNVLVHMVLKVEAPTWL